MKTKLYSPLLTAANNIVKTRRPLTKRAKEYDAFINWLDTSNKDVKKIKLPKVKKVEDLEFSIGSALGGGGGGGGLTNLLLGGAAGLGVRFLGKGIKAVKGFGKNAISKIFPKLASSSAKKAAVPAADITKKGVVKGWEHIATGAPRAVATGADDAAKIAAMKGGGKLATKGGELASKLIPGLATAVNLGTSAYRFSQGDVVGGSLSLASAIPILGWAAVGVDVAREFGAFEGTSFGLKKEKPKDKIDVRLKAQEKTQREAASASNVTFSSINDKFDKVVSKFEKIAGGMGAAPGKQPSNASTEDKMTEYGEYGERDQSASPIPGELKDLESTGGALPSSSPKGDKFGYSSWRGRNHNGIDYPLPEGTPISVIQPGTVADAGFRDDGYGNRVRVHHPGGVSTLYAHLSSINVASGQKIDPGTVIGKIGTTGSSTGPHLHFEVDVNGKSSNPEPYEDRLFRFGGNVKVKAKKGENKASQGMADIRGSTPDTKQQSIEDFAKQTMGKGADRILKDPKLKAQLLGEKYQFKNAMVKTPVTDPGIKQLQKNYNVYVKGIRERRQAQIAPGQTPQVPEAITTPLQEQTPGSAILLGQSQPAGQPSMIPVPIPMGGGGGNGGGVAFVSIPEGQILNSLWKTMLLTNLSSA